MQVLRTPDERFDGIDFYEPHYAEIGMRMAYVDEGPRDGAVVLMLHGEPSWSYLYRKMIPVFVDAGYRAVAPDLIGFGRSDKPSARADYTFQAHVEWMAAFLDAAGINDITLVGQDWGGLIGLRLVAAQPDRFARLVCANTWLPTGKETPTEAFLAWRAMSQKIPDLDCGRVLGAGTVSNLDEATIAAYNAPFPDPTFKAGAHVFPTLVPITPDDPSTAANEAAWEVLGNFKKPTLCVFGDSDPITFPAFEDLQKRIPGARDQPHKVLESAGHFLQEDKGEEFAAAVVDWMK